MTAQRQAPRTSVEELVETVLQHAGSDAARHPLVRSVMALGLRDRRVVVLGGGTGMSTIVGGNSGSADWADHPFVGLKQEFRDLDVVACTTDDGGSTGELLKRLPMIGIGDLRKSCVSMILDENLRGRCGLDDDGVRAAVFVVRRVFNYRFPRQRPAVEILRNPVLAADAQHRNACPRSLAEGLRALGESLAPGGDGPTIEPAGHALGNLLLTAAAFRAADGRAERAPGIREVRAGLDEIARLIGGTPGRLHAATSTPGQLAFRYTNGVEVYGQRKAVVVRRGLPVESVTAHFVSEPAVDKALLGRIRAADVIIYAPGSVYSSVIPVLQVRPITEAIRANRRALKILGANFWVQEGETDVSLRDGARGFLVSELIEAYDRNVPGGAAGLFDTVICANLENMPGNVLRNYALEGKRPIHLDRERVEGMGLRTVEATVFSREHLHSAKVVHHDPRNFALAVRTLLYAQESMGMESVRGARSRARARRTPQAGSSPVLCDYLASVRSVLGKKRFRPAALGAVLADIAWDNRDIAPEHLRHFEGARVVAAREWGRSTEWDNVLGYFDPEDRLIKIHESLLANPVRLRGDMLIALGESLLGRYIASRRWVAGGAGDARCYEIRLREAAARQCFLTDTQLRAYLGLARMSRDAGDPLVYRITVNTRQGFIPSGLLFGSVFAWYLDNTCSGPMEYEMSLLNWPPSALMPHQVGDRARKQALVRFFREVVFGYRS